MVAPAKSMIDRRVLSVTEGTFFARIACLFSFSGVPKKSSSTLDPAGANLHPMSWTDDPTAWYSNLRRLYKDRRWTGMMLCICTGILFILTFDILVVGSWRDVCRCLRWGCSWDRSIVPRNLGHSVHSSVFSRRYPHFSLLSTYLAAVSLLVTRKLTPQVRQCSTVFYRRLKR